MSKLARRRTVEAIDMWLVYDHDMDGWKLQSGLLTGLKSSVMLGTPGIDWK